MARVVDAVELGEGDVVYDLGCECGKKINVFERPKG
jgi:hypothetical protein